MGNELRSYSYHLLSKSAFANSSCANYLLVRLTTDTLVGRTVDIVALYANDGFYLISKHCTKFNFSRKLSVFLVENYFEYNGSCF